jgi:outer membrane protein OmpA-like peptidoglycan-associated protein
MKPRWISIGLGALLMVGPALLVVFWAGSAESRLREAEVATKAASDEVAVAKAANETYCTPELKKILRRVLQSCGLIGGRAGRGCQPVDAKAVATMSGADFNALFQPMQARGGIVQFDQGSGELDETDMRLVDRIFAERKGASYFFVVSRASPEGSIGTNRELSKQRAEGVLQHLQQTFNDPDLERQVGLLWLGEEYAQLPQEFCNWQRSGTSEHCNTEDLNRSAFITWIDCRL